MCRFYYADEDIMHVYRIYLMRITYIYAYVKLYMQLKYKRIYKVPYY